jgi:hypothetical protein
MLKLPSKSNIVAIQSCDTLELWGVANKPHIAAYGRHLLYKSKTFGFIPFWTGLALDQGGSVEIAVTFNKNLMDKLGKTQAFQGFAWKHAVIPTHCNLQSPSTVFVEICLESKERQNFWQTSNTQILEDFLNEVLGIL